jgi:TolB-like protein
MRPGEFDRDVARRQLDRVLQSPGFVRNERLSHFLRFIVERRLEGRESELKESVIAIEVFGRKPDYDPKLDSIVRTEATRLRARLAEYYAGSGGDAVVIDVPKGAYVPVFRSVETTPPAVVPIRRWPKYALATTLLLVVGAVAGWRWLARTPESIAIAVLPFENLGGDPAHNDFADGLTDEIIGNLSLIEGLAVRSRTSSFVFKGKSRNVRDAGQQLHVDYILEGSVLRAANRLRVNAQLVRVSDDFPLWSGRFDKELTDVFAIQDDISRAIVNNLRLNLGQGRRRYETSIEAYDLYLRARQLDPRNIKAVEGFQQVIAKDALFAPAYAGLAVAYAVRSVQFPAEHPTDELEQMRTAAEKALQMDPLLAEAHEALGMMHARNARWDEAEKSFRRALEIDPNRANTYDNYAYWLLLVLGRTDEALEQLHLMEKYDPLSPLVHSDFALALIAARRFPEAEARCLMLPPDEPFRNACLGRVRSAQGRFDEAIELLTMNGPVPKNPQNRAFLGYAYAKSGRRDLAERLLAESGYPNEQVLISAGLNDKDRTFEALDRMAAVGAQRVALYLNYPELELLRGDRRMKSFRKKIGLPN